MTTGNTTSKQSRTKANNISHKMSLFSSRLPQKKKDEISQKMYKHNSSSLYNSELLKHDRERNERWRSQTQSKGEREKKRLMQASFLSITKM